MTTEVVHGPGPEFEHEPAGGEYSLTLVGHYTTTPGWTCGGVTEHEYESDQGAKRLNELLGMRSIFHHWWLGQWAACLRRDRKWSPENALSGMSGRPVHHAAVHKPAALWVISPMFGAGFPQWEHNATCAYRVSSEPYDRS